MPKAYRLALAAFLLLSLLTLLPHATASAQAPSGPPAIWGGLAWIDGELAPPGTAIKAMQGTTVLGQGVVEADGRFKPFQIKQPTSGRSIIFLVGNALVPEPTRWVSGSLRIDLELRPVLAPSPAHSRRRRRLRGFRARKANVARKANAARRGVMERKANVARRAQSVHRVRRGAAASRGPGEKKARGAGPPSPAATTSTR